VLGIHVVCCDVLEQPERIRHGAVAERCRRPLDAPVSIQNDARRGLAGASGDINHVRGIDRIFERCAQFLNILQVTCIGRTGAGLALPPCVIEEIGIAVFRKHLQHARVTAYDSRKLSRARSEISQSEHPEGRMNPEK
jgi:hypothetical protein